MSKPVPNLHLPLFSPAAFGLVQTLQEAGCQEATTKRTWGGENPLREKGEWARGGREGCQTVLQASPQRKRVKDAASGTRVLDVAQFWKGLSQVDGSPSEGSPCLSGPRLPQDRCCSHSLADSSQWGVQSPLGRTVSPAAVPLRFSLQGIWAPHFYGHHNDAETRQHPTWATEINTTYGHTPVSCACGYDTQRKTPQCFSGIPARNA